ncbi:MAG: prephenate dehydrogenase [Thermoanaerobaculia bacterium]
MTRDVLIVGLGLIGGAVAMALRRRGWRVRFFDTDPGLLLEGAVRVADLGDADLIVLATPVDVAVELLPTIETRGVVTSVASVMRPLRAAAKGNFVAGHPMAGWHEGGLANAHHVELEGATWFVDAHDAHVEEMIRACGARPVSVTAAEHDAAVALTSHLPQVLSTALFAYLGDMPDVRKFAGGGLRSFRLAASDGAMWHSVLAENRDNLRPHAERIAQLVQAIIEGDEREAFARARTLWRALTE